MRCFFSSILHGILNWDQLRLKTKEPLSVTILSVLEPENE